ncbi:MAG: hypothetical protein ACK40M_14335 [Flavobacteriales bacterium]
MKKALFGFLLFAFPFVLAAQEEGETSGNVRPEKIPDIRYGLKGSFKLPTPIKNKAFTSVIDGIADANLSFHYPFLRHFYFGAGYRYSYFQINDFRAKADLNANLQIHSPFAVLGFERFATPRFLYGVSLRSGYSMLHFKSNTCLSNNPEGKGAGQEAVFIEPEFTLELMSGENMAFSFVTSWTWILDEFGAENICLSNFSGLTADDSKGYYQFISVGFGFTVFLGGEKRSKGPRIYYD